MVLIGFSACGCGCWIRSCCCCCRQRCRRHRRRRPRRVMSSRTPIRGAVAIRPGRGSGRDGQVAHGWTTGRTYRTCYNKVHEAGGYSSARRSHTMRCAESKGNMWSTLRTNLHEPRTNTNHTTNNSGTVKQRDCQRDCQQKPTTHQQKQQTYKDTNRHTHTSSPPATRKGLSASEVLSEEQEAVRTRAEHRRNGSHDE